MRRLLLAIALLLVPTQALALVGAVASHRSGHQVSPTWSFPTACLVHISAANVATAYAPASDTDLSRGLQLVAATTAATDGTIYQGRNTCDIDTGVVLAHTVNYCGLGTAHSVITSDAAVEIFYVYGACTVRNLKVTATGSALDCILVQGNGSGGATNQGNATIEYVETVATGDVTKPGVWLNQGSPASVANNGLATIRYSTIGGGFTAYNTLTLDRVTAANGPSHSLPTISVQLNGSVVSSNCQLSHDGTGNNNVLTATSTGYNATFTSTNDTYTLSAGTGSAMQFAGISGTKTVDIYNATITAPSGGNGVRVSGAAGVVKLWNGTITGPAGSTGWCLLRSAGTLKVTDGTNDSGYTATVYANSSGTITVE